MPEMEYTILHTTEVDDQNMPTSPGINGGMFKRSNDLKNPVITINVSSINDTLKQINERGGKTLRERVPVGDMGFVAYFEDCEGNVVGLWENAR